MRNILLFGAGKSATVLIDYLLQNAASQAWHLVVVDADAALAESKTGGSQHGTAVSFDINNGEERTNYIAAADMVISLLPPALHILVAKDCIRYKKNLLTASYVDAAIKSLEEDIKKNDLLFLCEMGLDPGIDHMSAKKVLDDIEKNGGTITSFISHCGGLVAPESDDNPWHYKISWNPRNVVMAGKGGAVYKQAGKIIKLNYEELFAEKRRIDISGYGPLCWYPNRDSLSYIATYRLNNCNTFIRTTLRHEDFIHGWKNVIHLKLTDEAAVYDTTGKSLAAFFIEHMNKWGFQTWIQEKSGQPFDASQQIIAEVDELMNKKIQINGKGGLQEQDDVVASKEAELLAKRIKEADLNPTQLFYLGLDDDQTIINKGTCSAADVLQIALVKNLALQPQDKDIVIMMHEIEYTKDGKRHKHTSTLIAKGRDSHHTAMAKTVGLPLGIGAKLILNGLIKSKGLHIPISREIYEPILAELSQQDIRFKDEISQL